MFSTQAYELSFDILVMLSRRFLGDVATATAQGMRRLGSTSTETELARTTGLDLQYVRTALKTMADHGLITHEAIYVATPEDEARIISRPNRQRRRRRVYHRTPNNSRYTVNPYAMARSVFLIRHRLYDAINKQQHLVSVEEYQCCACGLKMDTLAYARCMGTCTGCGVSDFRCLQADNMKEVLRLRRECSDVLEPITTLSNQLEQHLRPVEAVVQGGVVIM